MDGGIGLQFPSLLNGGILGRLDGKRLFHAAAENGIAVLVLFDKEVFVVLAHNCFRDAFDMIQDALRTKWKFVVEFEDEETNEISGTIGQADTREECEGLLEYAHTSDS